MDQFHRKVFIHTKSKRFIKAEYVSNYGLYYLDFVNQPFMSEGSGIKTEAQIKYMIANNQLQEVNQDTVKIIF